MGPRKVLTERFTSKNNAKENPLNKAKLNLENINSVTGVRKSLTRKKHVASFIKNQLDYISNLFDIIDIGRLNHGRRNLSDEEDGSEDLKMLNIPEKKLFKKHALKKGTGQSSSKSKPFPRSIEGLEKEFDEIKGTPMTYQKKLRKKGLQSRILKKKRKEDKKQQKIALKQGKKLTTATAGPAKLIKPVFNSDGIVVSNKFDFADTEAKKENKRKTLSASNEMNHAVKILKNDNQANAQNINDDSIRPNLKKEIKSEKFSKIQNEESKILVPRQGPVFNKDNKMVFSKVFIPENNKRKKTVKNPKKILQIIKENSKKISELEKEDKVKADSLKEKQKWAAALKRASGEKVKDDPELLKKSITKEKTRKLQSKKKWEARIEHVQKEKDDRQKKRTENIQARKNDKKKRKMKKTVKKGSYVQV